MRLEFLLAFLRMCRCSFTVVAVLAETGEVLRIAPVDAFGIKFTGLRVSCFELDHEHFVVCLLRQASYTGGARELLVKSNNSHLTDHNLCGIIYLEGKGTRQSPY